MPVRLCGVSALVNNVSVLVPLLPVRLGLDFAAATAEDARIATAERPAHQLAGNTHTDAPFVCMVITYSRVWIDRVRLSNLLVVS